MLIQMRDIRDGFICEDITFEACDYVFNLKRSVNTGLITGPQIRRCKFLACRQPIQVIQYLTRTISPNNLLDGTSGWNRFLLEECFAEHIGNSVISSTNVGIFNAMSAWRRNRFLDIGHCESHGSIYIGGGWRTTDGGYGDIEENFIALQQYGNYWKEDGWGLYIENRHRNGRIRNNIVYNSKGGIQTNSSNGDDVIQRNWLINSAPIAGSMGVRMADVLYDEKTGVLIQNNVAYNFDNFYNSVGTGYGSPYPPGIDMRWNIAQLTGSNTGKYPIYSKETADRYWLRPDGNRFYGYPAVIWNTTTDNSGYGSTNLTPLALNTSTADTSTLLSIVPKSFDLDKVRAGWNPALVIPQTEWITNAGPTWSGCLTQDTSG